MGNAELVFPIAIEAAELAERRTAVREVAESAGMSEAVQQKKLFLYLAERAVAGVEEAADEHFVATRVLGRPLDFDPGGDAGVRQLKRRLGQRLEEYYSGEGKRSRLRLVAGRGLCLRFVRVNAVTGVVVVPPRESPPGTPLEMALGLLVAELAETPELRVTLGPPGRRGYAYFVEGELLDAGSGEWLWILRFGDCRTGAVVFSSVSPLRIRHLRVDVRVGADRVREQLARMGAGE